jgi:hypothetical protein
MRCHICNEPFGPRGLPIHMAMRHGIRSQHGKGRLTDRMREAIRTGPDLLALQYPWPIEFGSREAAGWNRAFETMRAARAALATPPSGGPLDVERLAQMRDLVEAWLDAERLLDTMTIDDGPAHQDAWDAVHFSRERIAAEYARLTASDGDRE